MKLHQLSVAALCAGCLALEAAAVLLPTESVAAAPSAAASATGIFTQEPEVAPSQVADQEPEPVQKTDPGKLLQTGPVPEWIWGANNDTKYVLSKSFKGTAKAALLKATCDNVMSVKINGKNVASSSEWQQPVEVDVQKHLQDGENTIEAHVENQGGISGFVFKLALTRADGKVDYIVSDNSWQATATGEEKAAPAKVIGKLGVTPWNNVFDASRPGASVVRDVFQVLPGFQVERLFTVPKDQLGSWVCITTDNKGRIIASDQGGLGLCRITPPAIGSKEPTKVEHLDVKITSAQGLLYAFDSLYVCCNGGPGSGLYRVRDTNADDQYDEVVKLKDFRGGGEHGPHALRLAPDGKSIYVVAGNHTQPPFERTLNADPQRMGGVRTEQLIATLPENASSRLAPNWDEDLLLKRQWDGNGHATGVLAPGGWIAKTDPEGKTWEVVSSGYRNEYDFDFNADGEIFAYDADMEWDYGMPWYRPTRVVHATSGSEFGWRSGTGKWPTYYIDSLPQLVNIGPGSPVGAEFGYGTKFPAKYQKAFFICDWTFGTMYAVHIEPSGASYKAVKEEFVARTPLPLTDVTVGADGALYFTIGGRGAQSELFRVTYIGKESTAPVDAHDSEFAELRKLRHEIEAFHTPAADQGKAVAFLLPFLSHADRHIRYAARVGLERQPVESWRDAVLNSNDTQTIITGVVGLARQAPQELQPKLLATLKKLDLGQLDEVEQLALLRAYQLTFIRLGEPEDTARVELAGLLEPHYPATSDFVTRELCALLVFLRSSGVVAKTLPILEQERKAVDQDLGELLTRNSGYGSAVSRVLENQPDQQQIDLAFSLRNLKEGWTTEQRVAYFKWFEKARTWSGGNSYQKFLTHIEDEAFENCSDTERLALEALGARKPYQPPELPKAIGPGHTWTLAEILEKAATLKGRDFKGGQRAFAASRCVVCHRFGGDGGATGPDLTQLAGRFSLKDMAEAIVDPSKVISDQYKASVVETASGKVHTGRIVSESKDAIAMVIDPESSAKVIEIPRSEIEDLQPSKISLMPKDLLNSLNENEVLDLLAYLLSRGNPNDPMFRK